MHVLVDGSIDEEFIKAMCGGKVKGGEFLLEVRERPASARKPRRVCVMNVRMVL